MSELSALVAASAESPPEPGEFRAFGDALAWIRLPIPGPLHHINVWLLATEQGWLLVDTGMAIPVVEDAWRRLELGLPALASLERILVTHHHPDHFGMAARLADARGLEVRMSVPAAAAARPDPAGPESYARRIAAFADHVGLELAPEFGEFLSGSRYRTVISGLPRLGAPLEEGEQIPTRAGRFSVSLHHGHAPGHACLHAADTGLLISGDQVLPAISPNISLYPGSGDDDPLGRYLESLDRLGGLPEDTVVLPAHGRPFRGLAPRLAALRQEHAARLERILVTCRDGASTAEVVQSLFRMHRLDPLNRLLATTETLAHLRHLERRDRLRFAGRGPELRWTSA